MARADAATLSMPENWRNGLIRYLGYRANAGSEAAAAMKAAKGSTLQHAFSVGTAGSWR